MPIYEYRCKDCRHQFEIMQKINEKPKEKCPSCGGRLQKIFHPAGIIFKGDGFYITESRKEKEKSTAKKEEKKKEEKKTDDTKKVATN